MSCCVHAAARPALLSWSPTCHEADDDSDALLIYSGDSVRFTLEIPKRRGESDVVAFWWQIFDRVTEEPITDEPAEVAADEDECGWSAEFVVSGFVNDGPARARRTIVQIVAVFASGEQRTLDAEVWVRRRLPMPGIPGVSPVDERPGLRGWNDLIDDLVEGVL